MRSSVVFAVFVLAGCNRTDADKLIEVGHIDSAAPDEAAAKALDLAVEDANADPAHWPLGRRVVVRHAPAGNKPEAAGAQATRLIALNKVRCLIGGEDANQSKSIGIAAAGDSTIAISLADWPGVPPATNLFTIGIAPAERGRVLAKIAVEPKPATVIIVRDRAAVGANLAADEFVAECRAAGVRVIEQEIASPRAKAEVVFFACAAAQAIAARSPDDKVCLFGGGEAELPALVAGGVRADGFVVVTAFHADSGDEQTTAFVNRYRAKYGQPPSNSAALAYDAFMIWIEAVRRANSLDTALLREHLLSRSEPFATLTGPLTFAGDHTARRKIFVGKLAEGKVIATKSFDPAPAKQPHFIESSRNLHRYDRSEK